MKPNSPTVTPRLDLHISPSTITLRYRPSVKTFHHPLRLSLPSEDQGYSIQVPRTLQTSNNSPRNSSFPSLAGTLSGPDPESIPPRHYYTDVESTMPPIRTIASRACDGCKRRKVKCDTSQPCANCHISRLACEYTACPRKRGPKVATLAIIPDTPPTEGPIVEQDVAFSLQQPCPLSNTYARSQQEELSLWRLVNNSNSSNVGDLVYPSRLCRLIDDTLVDSMRTQLPALSMAEIVTCCIDLYMQYTFPTAPLVHEPTLRADVMLLFGGEPSNHAFDDDDDDDDEEQRLSQMRAFAMLTALCASVASVMPSHLLPYGYLVTKPFFNASREMLSGFESFDLEYPSSASLTIRIFHSTTFQQTTGKTSAAWHVYGHAALLAQSLHLYREESLVRHDPVESCLLRTNF